MSDDRLLDALEVHLEPFAFCELRGSATLGLGRRTQAVLHYVLAGEGTLVVDGGPMIAALPGTMVLVPAFAAHSLRTDGGGRGLLPDCRPLALPLHHLSAGSGDGGLAAVCGRVSIVYRGLNGAMDLLRSTIVERLDESDRVRATFDELIAELAAPSIGTGALTRALLLQCVLLLFRRRLLAGDPALAWTRGLSDEGLWQAVRAILDHPERDHSVQSLADTAGMSRTSFAQRFGASYGTGPIELLRTVRLRRAAELLSASDLPVKRVAALVGYQSRGYFIRAFNSAYGVAPDLFRRSVERRSPWSLPGAEKGEAGGAAASGRRTQGEE